jgi:hypothetical protein
MNDDLRNRITNIDPMHPGVPTQSTTSESSQERLEKIMSTPLKEKSEPAPAPRKTWVIGIAAVAALVLAVAAGIGLTSGGDDPAVAAPLELDAGGEDVMASCIMFSSAELEKVAEIAFAGTVTAVDGDAVTLTVDEWYRGGDSAEAVLNAPQGMEALIGGIPFQVGDAYLISAQGGNVNYCGFSGPLSPEYQAVFEEAFG